ncbi:MAG TPA: DUF4129 domain-containing protein [Pseudonocardiaceae bacterium]|jgi:hypothetical protein|nr:DUF4129 domain-containing protein [Pseudonocardiaceae bacterium]
MRHSAQVTSVRPLAATRRVRLLLLLSLAVLLLLAVLATRGGSAVPRGNGLVLRAPDAVRVTQTAQVDPGQGHLNSAVTAGLTGIVAIVLLSYLVGMIVLLVMLSQIRIRRGRKMAYASGADEGDLEGKYAASAVVLLRGARAALLNLRQRAGGPPSDAVQQAWLVLEESAAESGTARRPEQTSTEFTSAVLSEHDVDPGALATLRTLYQRARFGRPDAVTDADAERAIDALDRIADTLTVHARTARTANAAPTDVP